MKTMLTLLLVAITMVSYSQSLERDEIDKYTKNHVKETSWFKLKEKFAEVLSCRAHRINDRCYLELSVSMHSVFRADERSISYILFEDSSTIEVTCVRGGIADYIRNKYDSYWNGRYLYELKPEHIEPLVTKNIFGVRITIGDEYTLFENIKGRCQERMQKAIELIK